jgi:hypothetical protein
VADASSEHASEKPKRGRPEMIPNWALDQFAALVSLKVKSKRHKQNLWYAKTALAALLNGCDRIDPRFDWLCTDQRFVRLCVLAELGRLGDPEEIRNIAARICERKLNTVAAVAVVRRHRLGQSSSGDAGQLCCEITRLIDAYLARHPATTQAEVLKALKMAVVAVQRPEEEPPP